MSEQRRNIIARKARIWPEITRTTLSLPALPEITSTVHPLVLIFIVCSMAGLGVYTILLPIFLTRFGYGGFFLLALLTLCIFIILGGLLSLFFQWLPDSRRKQYARSAYTRKLADLQIQLQKFSLLECQARIDLDPPLFLPSHKLLPGYEQLSVVSIIHRSLDNQDLHLWARRSTDPDFLSVRLGMGYQSPHFQLLSTPQSFPTTPPNRDLQSFADNAYSLLTRYSSLITPVQANLAAQNTTVLLGSQARLYQARQMACTMLAYLAYHHSPEDVRMIVLAPESQRTAWEWTALLPHTLIYDLQKPAHRYFESSGAGSHAVAIGNAAVLQQLPLLAHELRQRASLLSGSSMSLSASSISSISSTSSTLHLPYLVIFVDYFDSQQDLDQPARFLADPLIPFKQSKNHAPDAATRPPQLTISPLQRPELLLALNSGTTLNVSVVTICNQSTSLPPSANLLIDLDGPLNEPLPAQQLAQQARIRDVASSSSTTTICTWLDDVPLETLRLFAARMQTLRPLLEKSVELRTQVDFAQLFSPSLDLNTYMPGDYWNKPQWHLADGSPSLCVPIGLQMGDEPQYLDLLNDGPHGLLIGQTGSGKSELLQTIIAALALVYRPDEVNFLLVDHTLGVSLEPFSQLPHTVGFLAHVSSPPLIQRFLALLQAEALRRARRLKEGKVTPHLLIIIDEFAEMLRHADEALDDLFSITHAGRALGMHLLLAAQRPVGHVALQACSAVQYRLCLRCNSPEESRAILQRVDAASLPASIPGRGYFLHGDNQFDLFQAARVNIPLTSQLQKSPGLLGRDVETTPVTPQHI